MWKDACSSLRNYYYFENFDGRTCQCPNYLRNQYRNLRKNQCLNYLKNFPHPNFSTDEISTLRGKCFHPARSVGQADLYYLSGRGEEWILKDFSARPAIVRLLLTRRVLRAETRALQSLSGIQGIPRFGGYVGRDAFLLERLDADRLPHLGGEHGLTPEFFDRAAALLGQMHGRGWSHGDLRRKNILVDRDLRPYLIDFATAIYGGPGASFGRRWLFHRVARVDQITLARIKQSYLPQSLTKSELAALEAQPLSLRLGRWLKKKIYRPLKRRHRRELWGRIRKFLGGEK